MFVEEYLRDLRRAGYTPRAAARYVARCARLSLDAAIARPRALRGVALAGIGHLVGLLVAASALSFLVDRELAVAYFVRSVAWLAGGLLWISLHLGMFSEDAHLPRSGLGLPNFLTLGRLLSIPAFQLLLTRGHDDLALVALLVGAFSDVVDGVAARRMGTTTRLGHVFDPLVDILFQLMVTVTLTQVGLLPGWMLVLVFLRYGLLLVGGTVIYVMRGPVRIAPTVLGKVTGLITMSFLVGVLLAHRYLPADSREQVFELAYLAIGFLLALTIIQVVIIGIYNVRHLGEPGQAEGPLAVIVGVPDPREEDGGAAGAGGSV